MKSAVSVAFDGNEQTLLCLLGGPRRQEDLGAHLNVRIDDEGDKLIPRRKLFVPSMGSVVHVLREWKII